MIERNLFTPRMFTYRSGKFKNQAKQQTFAVDEELKQCKFFEFNALEYIYHNYFLFI